MKKIITFCMFLCVFSSFFAEDYKNFLKLPLSEISCFKLDMPKSEVIKILLDYCPDAYIEYENNIIKAVVNNIDDLFLLPSLIVPQSLQDVSRYVIKFEFVNEILEMFSFFCAEYTSHNAFVSLNTFYNFFDVHYFYHEKKDIFFFLDLTFPYISKGDDFVLFINNATDFLQFSFMRSPSILFNQ